MLSRGSRTVKKVNERIVLDFSKEEIIMKLDEEMHELMVELLHNNRGDANHDKVVEEIGDVQLMLWQVMYSYKIVDKDFFKKVDNGMYEKIGRTENRLDLEDLSEVE